MGVQCRGAKVNIVPRCEAQSSSHQPIALSHGAGGGGRLYNQANGQWSTPQEFNRVGLSDVARDHGIIPVRPDGKQSHAFTTHKPENNNLSRKGEGSSFSSYRMTINARAENYAANAALIKSLRPKAGSDDLNVRVTVRHDHSLPVGEVWGQGLTKTSSATTNFGIVWDKTSGIFRELTGFLSRKR